MSLFDTTYITFLITLIQFNSFNISIYNVQSITITMDKTEAWAVDRGERW